MSFRTPNSSFIFDRRLRSIKLWAVLRAILRPALDPAACLPFLAVLLPALLLAGAGCVLLLEVFAGAADEDGGALEADSEFFGLTWIILRERVGGGGRA